MKDVDSAADEIISRRPRVNRSGTRGLSGTMYRQCVGSSVCNGKANSISIKDEGDSSTPLEAVPDDHLHERLQIGYNEMAIQGRNDDDMMTKRKRVFIQGITLSRGQMAIGRMASGGALAPEPAARHRSRTRFSTGFLPVFLFFCGSKAFSWLLSRFF